MIGVGLVKPLLVSMGVLSVITVGTFMWGQAQKRLAKQYGVQFEQTNAMLIQTREAKERLLQELVQIHEKYQTVQEGLQDALKSNPDWSSTAVPIDVSEWLCNSANCAPLRATPDVPSPRDQGTE